MLNGILFSVKTFICLPPNLFEDIQSKGIEIFWPIPHDHLKVCLSNREALNWVKVELTEGELSETDLLNVAKSNLPLRQLSLQAKVVTDKMMAVIERFSSTIEVLELCYPQNSDNFLV